MDTHGTSSEYHRLFARIANFGAWSTAALWSNFPLTALSFLQGAIYPLFQLGRELVEENNTIYSRGGTTSTSWLNDQETLKDSITSTTWRPVLEVIDSLDYIFDPYQLSYQIEDALLPGVIKDQRSLEIDSNVATVSNPNNVYQANTNLFEGGILLNDTINEDVIFGPNNVYQANTNLFEGAVISMTEIIE